MHPQKEEKAHIDLTKFVINFNIKYSIKHPAKMKNTTKIQ